MSKLSVVCCHCNVTFLRLKSQVDKNIKRGSQGPFCTRKCRGLATRALSKRILEGTCTACNVYFRREVNLSDKARGIACSLTCAAKLANEARSAMLRLVGPPKYQCSCGGRKHAASRSCQQCHSRGLDLLQDRTLAELRSQSKTQAYHARVRGLARLTYKAFGGSMSCAACGYSLHVDICHIRPVASFAMETTLREVNAQTNLVALDKRCHWEFDHGDLVVKDGAWVRAGLWLESSALAI